LLDLKAAPEFQTWLEHNGIMKGSSLCGKDRAFTVMKNILPLLENTKDA